MAVSDGQDDRECEKMEGKDLSGISERDFFERQKVIDVEKWLASEQAGRDLCGTMHYCVFCVKAEMNPCAKAEFRGKMRDALNELESETAAADESAERETEDILAERSAEEEAVQALAEDRGSESVRERIRSVRADETAREIPAGYEEVTRYRRTFKSKLIQNERAQDHYTELKNALAELSGVKSRVCQGGENFRVGRNKVAVLKIAGKTLMMYLALDPCDYEDTKYRFTDVSDKKTYAETPMKVKITSARALKHAKELIADLSARLELANVGCIYMDYHFPYKTDEQLIAKGLIKPYKVLVKKKTPKISAAE